MSSSNILGRIVHSKKEEVSVSKSKIPLKEMKQRTRDVAPALDFARHLDPVQLRSELPATRIIAEIKKASPSGGLIRPVYRPSEIAREYIDAGAAALSILTDGPYFQGSLKDFDEARKVSKRPLLRKDFMIDEYQIYEARAHGADCILGIVAILEKSRLEDFCALAWELGMAALVEVHDEAELKSALELDAKIILGINNRNLKTLETDIAITEKLIAKIPGQRLVVSESGLKTRQDIERLRTAGARAFLIGEHLLKEKNLSQKFKEMLGE